MQRRRSSPKSYGRSLTLGASLFFLTTAVADGQSAGTPSAATAPGVVRPAYLVRGDEVERRYQAHRERLERFFSALSAALAKEAPELRDEPSPPTPVPFGYQILPILKPDPPPAKGPKGPSRVTLSPFSWSRTDSMIDRGGQRLSVLETRLDSATRATDDDRRRQYKLIIDEYKKLVDGQKLMASIVQYNRLWQGEIARLPQAYADTRILQHIVLTRQSLLDSLSLGGGQNEAGLRARADSLSRRIAETLRKSPAPDFVRVDQPTPHQWIVSVPLYTDIADSAFIESARAAIEEGWHARDGNDDYSVKLDVRRVSPSQLYRDTAVPVNGAHIDIPGHVSRFPPDGAVLMTGGNLTYLFGRGIILGPHAIPRGILVHEFGHILGFKDAYFRSYEDSGPDGYKVLEVILDPEDILGVPENGRVTRGHFEAILKERLK